MAGPSVGGNIKPWSVDDSEISYNLEKTAKTMSSSEAAEWKLYVPKLMPLITMGLPKETTISLSSTMFANEKSCKPTIQKTIKSRNYVKATRGANCSFAHALKWHGMKVEVEIVHENMENLRIDNFIDETKP